VDLEALRRALRELAEREPAFFRDLLLAAPAPTAPSRRPCWSCWPGAPRPG
jgi:hypothetical protein